MSQRKVTVYTMKFCPYCMRAKETLEKRGVTFEEILLSEDDDAQWEALFKKSGMKTMPQIFFGDQLIGGYTELAELDKKDKLGSLK